MKNFPSALIKQQNTKNGIGSNWKDTLENIGTQALSNIFGGKNKPNSKDIDKEFGDGYERPEMYSQMNEIDIMHQPSNVQALINKRNSQVSLLYNHNNGKSTQSVSFEDPFKISSSIFSIINNYKYVFANAIPSILESGGLTKKGGEEYGMTIMETVAVPSLFNPYNTVEITGITENIPLIDREIKNASSQTSANLDESAKEINITSEVFKRDADITDCSIKKLVELSSDQEGKKLGLATYRYADFMYCKDLGKIPNNRLITLRKFPGPVGDNIFTQAYPSNSNNSIWKSYPDIGRLITWFDNDDNKLEEICRYDYEATWKEFTSEIQQETSQQKDDGLLNRLSNLFSSQNNVLTGQGFSSNNGALAWGANMLHIPILSGNRASSQYYGWETLGNYDKHRIYEPANRIWDTHKYEGRLKFNQEINLTFRYTLRSYDNINPKSAMLDLIGNIMVVTYRRGSFWGGESRIIGPQGNNSVYETGNAWINWGFDKLGGIWNRIMTSGIDMDAIQGWLSNLISSINEGFNQAQKMAENVVQNGKEVASDLVEKGGKKLQQGMEQVTDANKKYKWTDALKGMIKNQLGRPAIYAMNSLLSGENVGPWHLTIGNPRNPIMSMGNMIMTHSEVTHTGPLGIDDFPTELIVKVTLKHGRPRDMVEIQKMYTKGLSAIYKPMNLVEIDKFWANRNAFPDVTQYASLGNMSENQASPRPQTGGSTSVTGPTDPSIAKLGSQSPVSVLAQVLGAS